MPRKKRAGVNAKGRNKGDGQYLPIPYAMARSAAFRSLSGPALKVFIELRCRYDGTNNGKLSLSYQCAADLLGIGKSTVKRAFDELGERGFIIRKRQGQWYGRLAAEYIVTDRSMDGQQPTRDWQRWKPESGAKKQKSVPERNAKAISVPQQDRKADIKCRQSTYAPNLCTADGAVRVPPILSCGGSRGA